MNGVEWGRHSPLKRSPVLKLVNVCTEGEIKVCTWLREISSCSYLTVLPGPAWVLLSKTNEPLFPPLYIVDWPSNFISPA